MTQDAWTLLKSGAEDDGIQEIKNSYLRERTPSRVMALGVAYLWIKRYQAAWEHFQSFNQRYPKHGDIYYAMAGTAQWCRGKYKEASREWVEGLNCQYTDMARVTIPLLLYFASVWRPHVFSSAEAEHLLIDRATSDRIQHWPGPIAAFVSGQIDEASLLRQCAGFHEHDTARRRWRIKFYLATVERSCGNARCVDLLRKFTSLTDEEFVSDRDAYLGKLWAPELYLARHELQNDVRGGEESDGRF